MPFTAHPILRNAFSLSTGEFLAKALGFAASVYLGRVLGAAGFGVIGFAAAMVTYFALFVNPGLDTIGIREIAADPERAQRTVSGVLTARLLLLLPAGAAFLLILQLGGFPPEIRAVLLAYGATLLLLPVTIDFHFIGTERMGAVAVRKAVQAAVYLAAIILTVKHPGQLAHVPLALLGATLLSVLLQPLFLRRSVLHFERETLSVIPVLLRSALFVGGAQLLILTYLQIDLVMCGFLLPAEDVGRYTAAQRIIGAVSLLPMVLLQAWMPVLSRAASAQERRDVLRRFLRVMVLPGVAIAVLGALFAPELLRIIFGNSYLAGGVALRILFASSGLVFVNMALANPLLAWKRDREYFVIVLGGALLNVALNAVLIPAVGITGAAVATLSAEALVLLLALRAQRSLWRAAS